MRNSINYRSNVVVVGNRQGYVVVAGSDRLRAPVDAQLFGSRLAAKSPRGMAKGKPTAAMRRAACATRHAACHAGRLCAGIPARQWRETTRSLPQTPSSRS